MTTATLRPFRSGNSQALRLPKDMAFADDAELTAVRSGDVLTIYPKNAAFKAAMEALKTLPRPTSVEVRDVEEIPERPGL